MAVMVQLVMASVGLWMAAGGSQLSWSLVPASTKPPKIAATRLDEVDGDFALQGEYSGWMCGPCGGQQVLGLQVVAQGDGRFAARGYVGGLPGSGPVDADVWQWRGKRIGPVVELRGDHGRIALQDGAARLFDREGAPLGQLSKVSRKSRTLGAAPPPGAVVLFDGTDRSQLVDARLTADGNLAVGAKTRMPVRDFRLHVEFRIPYMPYARGQGRGNSGLYLQQRYEVQVLDSFGLEPVFNGCAALYRQQAPRLNMSLPPLSWQTYDIWFTAARWDCHGNKVCPARITVLHNGVAVHCRQVIVDKTGHGAAEGPEDKPILFQNHGNPVAYRNVWLVPMSAPTTSFARRTRPHLRGRLLGRRR